MVLSVCQQQHHQFVVFLQVQQDMLTKQLQSDRDGVKRELVLCQNELTEVSEVVGVGEGREES